MGKSAQKNPPGKSPAKSSKNNTTKIPDTFLQRGWANAIFMEFRHPLIRHPLDSVFQLFPDLYPSFPICPFWDHFPVLSRDFPDSLRLLNALNSEVRGLKVRFSLAMIVFETFELILCQMLSSQGKKRTFRPLSSLFSAVSSLKVYPSPLRALGLLTAPMRSSTERVRDTNPPVWKPPKSGFCKRACRNGVASFSPFLAVSFFPFLVFFFVLLSRFFPFICCFFRFHFFAFSSLFPFSFRVFHFFPFFPFLTLFLFRFHFRKETERDRSRDSLCKTLTKCEAPKCGRSKRGRTQKHANECKKAQKGAKELKIRKQPGYKRNNQVWELPAKSSSENENIEKFKQAAL